MGNLHGYVVKQILCGAGNVGAKIGCAAMGFEGGTRALGNQLQVLCVMRSVSGVGRKGMRETPYRQRTFLRQKSGAFKGGRSDMRDGRELRFSLRR